MDALEEQKCLQMKQNNRLIKGFKPDALPSLLVQKNKGPYKSGYMGIALCLESAINWVSIGVE